MLFLLAFVYDLQQVVPAGCMQTATYQTSPLSSNPSRGTGTALIQLKYVFKRDTTFFCTSAGHNGLPSLLPRLASLASCFEMLQLHGWAPRRSYMLEIRSKFFRITNPLS